MSASLLAIPNDVRIAPTGTPGPRHSANFSTENPSRRARSRHAADSAAGQANGENLKLNGGRWYVISPKGRLVKHRS